MTGTGLYKVAIAFPGNILPYPLEAPEGFVFLVDHEGAYLTDDDGLFLVVRAT